MPPPPPPPAAPAYDDPAPASSVPSATATSFQDLDISSPPGAPGGSSSAMAGPASRFDATVGVLGVGGAAANASPDLAVAVGNPCKVGEGMSAYFTYEVTTKTSLPQYAFGQFSVTRRFRDFDWLHSQLCAKFAGAIVPPLPDKHAAQVSTMKVTGVAQSAQWLEDRRGALQRFLQRLVAHPTLHNAPDLQAFLEKPDDALDAWKELSKPKGSAGSSVAALSQVTMADVKSGASSLYSKSLSLFAGEGTPSDFKPVEDVPCQQMGNYAAAMQTQVTAVHKHSKAYVDRHREVGNSLTGFGLALTQLANCEAGTNASLAKGLSSMGLCVGRLSATYGELAERETNDFEEPMREYIRILTAVKAAIEHRAIALRAHNAASALLLAKQERLEKLRTGGGKEEKVSQQAREVREAEEAANLAKSEYELVAARVDSEMARFQSEKLVDFKRHVTSFIGLQIEYSERVQAAWRELLPRLEDIDTEALPGPVGVGLAAAASDE